MTEIIIAQAHEVLRHFGLQKTADHIQHHYWWPFIGQDVEQYCKMCPICQTMKSGAQKVPGLLHSLPIPTCPWESIAMDFVGPFPESNGHNYLWVVLQSTDQFFLFTLLWTTQYTARSTAPSTYKYSTCTRTSYPARIILTASPTCLQPVPYQPPPLVRCHRLLRTPPRLCPATATSGKPASPTSATFRRRDVQPHPCQQFHRPLWSPPAPLTKR